MAVVLSALWIVAWGYRIRGASSSGGGLSSPTPWVCMARLELAGRGVDVEVEVGGVTSLAQLRRALHDAAAELAGGEAALEAAGATTADTLVVHAVDGGGHRARLASGGGGLARALRRASGLHVSVDRMRKAGRARSMPMAAELD